MPWIFVFEERISSVGLIENGCDFFFENSNGFEKQNQAKLDFVLTPCGIGVCCLLPYSPGSIPARSGCG